jgi:RNA polymerase sigma-70 factor (ECF subfamily)
LQLLAKLLRDLDDAKREVFVLAELEEMTAPEISEALDIPLNTVYSRLRAARQLFEQALARHSLRDKGGKP